MLLDQKNLRMKYYRIIYYGKKMYHKNSLAFSNFLRNVVKLEITAQLKYRKAMSKTNLQHTWQPNVTDSVFYFTEEPYQETQKMEV